MLMLPVSAGASVDPDAALHAYARARLADSDGALNKAVASYGNALESDPTSLDIARRSYVQALESGDMALALRSAGLLDDQAILPRDGTLLRICEALARKDWTLARQFTDRLMQEGNFAFLAPIVNSWISIGAGTYEPPVVVTKDRFGALVQRYIDEHVALQALARGDLTAALPAMGRALALRPIDAAGLRLTFAGQLAARRAKTEALALLPVDEANYATARADIVRGKGLGAIGAPLTPRQGFGRLLARLAMDVSSDSAGAAMGIRLARIAGFADPAGSETHIVAAHLLTIAGYSAYAVDEANRVLVDGWYGALGQAELVDALVEEGDPDQAIALAKALAAKPGAEPERHLRLGRLLMARKDFSGAAAAFGAAQTHYRADDVPWALLLFQGSALEQAERWDEARAVLKRAVTLAPNEPVVLNYLGYAKIERRQDIAAALALLKKANALKPQDASITDSLGWAQFITGDVQAAVPILERAAVGAPTDVTINEHLGDALWVAGRRYEARYAWRAASVFAEGAAVTRLAAKAKEGLKPEYAAP